MRARTGLVIDAYFSGDEGALHPRRGAGRAGARRARRARLRDDRQLAALPADAGAACTRRSTRTRRARMLYDIHARDVDDAAARGAAHPARDAARGARLERRLRRDATPSGSARRSRSRAWRATSRRRCSARAASTPGSAQEHLRHRLLPADEHGREAPRSKSGPAHDDRVGHRRPGRVRARGQHLRRGRGGPVAARRARPDRDAGGERGGARARSRTPAASTWCRPSSGSARRTGTSARAARWSGSRAARRASTSIRATLEAIAYQTRDVVECVRGRRRDSRSTRCASTAARAATTS